MTDPKTVTVQERLRERAEHDREHSPALAGGGFYYLCDEAADLLDRCKEALTKATQLLDNVRPRDGYALAWRCERAVTAAREVLTQLGGRNV